MTNDAMKERASLLCCLASWRGLFLHMFETRFHGVKACSTQSPLLP